MPQNLIVQRFEKVVVLLVAAAARQQFLQAPPVFFPGVAIEIEDRLIYRQFPVIHLFS